MPKPNVGLTVSLDEPLPHEHVDVEVVGALHRQLVVHEGPRLVGRHRIRVEAESDLDALDRELGVRRARRVLVRVEVKP